MTVKDFLSKMTDSYHVIEIQEQKDDENQGVRWYIKPHFENSDQIPKRILNREICKIILYYDRLTIKVEQGYYSMD